MMTGKDWQSEGRLVGNVRVQLDGTASQILFVSVMSAGQRRGRLLNEADAGTKCRGV
jgi:hypothetical protein